MYITIKNLITPTILILFLLPLTLSSCGQSMPPKPKQVVFITVDTTRADHFGCYGNKVVKTPNIDKLAADSVVFNKSYSTTHTTIPSHTSIFTSLHLKDHGVVNMGQALPDFEEFMPKVFENNGYITAAFTSGGHLTPLINIDQGFQTFNFPESRERIAEEVNQKILKWLEGNKDKDFFVWAHYFDPHENYDPPESYAKMYTFKSEEKLSELQVRNMERLKKNSYYKQSQDPEFYRNLYKGEVSYLDSQIGVLVKKLKELKIYDDCIIVLVADHGEYLGEHTNYFTHGGGIHDEVIRVPLFFKQKRSKAKGSRDQLVSSVDIYPTLMEMLGLKYKNTIRGKSLKAILDNQNAPEKRDRVYFESIWRIDAGVKTHDFTYIRNLYRIKEMGKVDGFKTIKSVEFIENPAENQMLYNNQKDPSQSNNLAKNKTGLSHKFNREIIKFSKETIRASKKATTIEDKKHLEKLKDLGYIK